MGLLKYLLYRVKVTLQEGTKSLDTKFIYSNKNTITNIL